MIELEPARHDVPSDAGREWTGGPVTADEAATDEDMERLAGGGE